MKINMTGSLFRGYRTSVLGGTGIEAPSSLLGRAKSDQLTISKQVLAMLETQNRIREMEERLGNSPESQTLDTMSKAMKTLKTCSTIAARIKAGDKVPLKDLQYLMRNDPQAYHLAMAARKPKENPKEWDSAVPKEEQEECRTTRDTLERADGAQASTETEGSSWTSSGGDFSGGTGAGANGGGV
ncbi:MAG TPA: hypothetical protein H9873_10215 [Candidatus Dorea gallistercoris]|uniref:Uncharacterized protein n=1 Tax=Candidatus Dorea gallistercoris TaxID=2838542 RepID=A0A9D1RC21_9FIRM|nr:hypothetical protein [Candidatus Dorea gallistercoris]